MSDHTFNINIATKFGLDVAIIMQVFIQCNFTDKKNSDGLRWIYLDEKEFYDYFNYWSRNKIKSLINKCVSLKLLLPHPEDRFCYAVMIGESK